MPVVDVAGRDVEPAGDRQHHLAVAVGVEVPDAKVERVEERRAAAVDRRPVERDAQRVDRGWCRTRACRRPSATAPGCRAPASAERQHVAGLRVRRRRLSNGRM